MNHVRCFVRCGQDDSLCRNRVNYTRGSDLFNNNIRIYKVVFFNKATFFYSKLQNYMIITLLILYNKCDIIIIRGERDLEKLNYKIIKSGSSGNCVIIDDIMIDCGVPFSSIKDHLPNVKYLLLTHIHTDHINRTTYARIKKLYPNIKIIGNYQVFQLVGVNIISNDKYPIITEDYIFTPFDLLHDVVTQGFTWATRAGKIIYATDTNNLDNAPVDKYDYLFLESNHDIKKLEKARGNSGYGYNVYENGLRHLSTKKCFEFYYMNRSSRDSELIELHKSKRFY